MTDFVAFAIGAAVGLAAAGGGWELLRRVRVAKRRTTGPAGAFESHRTGSTADGWPAVGSSPVHPVGGESAGPGRTVPSVDLPARSTGVIGESDDAFGPQADELRVLLSSRAVLHLFRFRGLGPDDVARPESTQKGIARALAAQQSAVSKVLRRLIAAGVIEVARRHVRGGERRLKVYVLTRRGEALAIDLKRSLKPGPSARGFRPEPERAMVPPR